MSLLTDPSLIEYSLTFEQSRIFSQVKKALSQVGIMDFKYSISESVNLNKISWIKSIRLLGILILGAGHSLETYHVLESLIQTTKNTIFTMEWIFSEKEIEYSLDRIIIYGTLLLRKYVRMQACIKINSSNK